MGLINYEDIDFKKSITKINKVVEFNGQQIEIVPYLSTKDKYDVIMITLQKSFENNIYNTFKMEVHFLLNIVYSYTNVVFPQGISEDELFDILDKSGFIELVLKNIDQKELDSMKKYIQDMSDIIMHYRNTFGAVFESFIEMLPENMEKASTLIDHFDIAKYKPLLELAADLKGGNI